MHDADTGDDAGNPECGVSGCGGQDTGSHTSGGEGVPGGPASGVGNLELGTGAATAGVGEDVVVEEVVPSVDHGHPMAPETVDVAVEDAAVDEVCANPPLGQSGESVASPAGDVDRAAGSDSSGNPDVEGAPCRKKQKDLTDEGMGVEKAPRGNEPSEGEVVTKILDVPPIAMEGSQWGADAEDFNTITLTKQGGGCEGVLVPASWLRGLINLVPIVGVGDKSRRYCIGNLAMDMFTELLHKRQHTYSKLCWMSIFLKHHTNVILHNKARIAAMIWDTFKRPPHADVRYLLMLSTLALLQRIVFILAFLRSATYADAAHGHDCGVFVMAFMELLSLKADGFHFDQDCVPLYRDKCLLSFIQGRLAHFPQHLRGLAPS
ncbi:hypothetical protein Cgig2_001172 [Carnegiea gigantea]|uniref:Ubiquitin-like protease family profile domain-containing protein n=1 Tax=Carnegiea gigantea TaxID=171969 RepID=A0A9Q1Q8H3_9CARY|nr:hypothetical protein Cgig2_001172 [Carnegiea gigantea]